MCGQRHTVKFISFRKFCFFLWNFVVLFFQPNFFKNFSEGNRFHCVPVVRTYFLVILDNIMVSKVSQKNFEVCATKRHKPRNFEVQKFRCAFGCTYLIFCAQTRFTRVVLQKKSCWPAGRLKARIQLSWGFGGFRGRWKKNSLYVPDVYTTVVSL